MENRVQVQQVASRTTAVVRRRAKVSELAQVLPQGCGEVWTFLRSSQIPHPGRNLALYLDEEMNLEAGVEVAKPFAGNDRVFCSCTAAGTVATLAHVGPYHRLPEAHEAIRQWCLDNGHALAGPNWEVYDHWNDDPAQLRTDVFYLLQASGEPVT